MSSGTPLHPPDLSLVGRGCAPTQPLRVSIQSAPLNLLPVLSTSVLLRTTRWRVAATAAVAAAVMCVPAIPAQAVVDEGASVRSDAMLVATTVGFSGGRWGDPAADRVSNDAQGTYRAAKDPGSLYTVGKAIGARGLWAQADKSGGALTGQGVSVAVLDTGVSDVLGLDGAGKVTYGPDLSIEGNGVLTQQDTFGHGTFMAGIIAGRGTTAPSSDLSAEPANVQLGVAPDAKLLALNWRPRTAAPTSARSSPRWTGSPSIRYCPTGQPCG
jgi:subtilisin family serine protease